MPWTEGIGLIAGALTTIAFIPQAWRVWQTRSARDISLVTFLTFFVGIAVWLAYGLLIGSVAVTAANAVTLVLAAAILIGKLRFG
jgi:MtN3 and saliva related transmembrane protein